MLRKLKPDDKERLENLLRRIPNFSDSDYEVAMELIDIAINFHTQTDYNIFVYEDEGEILGYHCTGRRALTDAVFDLYWIVSDPAYKEKRIGHKLLQHAEEFVKEQKGRWILAETTSKESYDKTRKFYEKNDYKIIARIDDFYAEGENLIIYGKKFNYN
jgi:ribosomal protein S18 acetylase RimI-like enzyme